VAFEEVDKLFARTKAQMVDQDQALPGRTDRTMPVPTEPSSTDTP
jgi:hypothetical protein